VVSIFEMEFTRSIILERFQSQDVYGKSRYDEAETVEAIVDYMVKNLKDFRGNEYMSSAWIALPPGTAISRRDRITLPDGTQPYIGSIAEVFDESIREPLYIEVYVGRIKPGEGVL
jgi:hypothetical protein